MMKNRKKQKPGMMSKPWLREIFFGKISETELDLRMKKSVPIISKEAM
jgi:hypothetical protein